MVMSAPYTIHRSTLLGACSSVKIEWAVPSKPEKQTCCHRRRQLGEITPTCNITNFSWSINDHLLSLQSPAWLSQLASNLSSSAGRQEQVLLYTDAQRQKAPVQENLRVIGVGTNTEKKTSGVKSLVDTTVYLGVRQSALLCGLLLRIPG